MKNRLFKTIQTLKIRQKLMQNNRIIPLSISIRSTVAGIVLSQFMLPAFAEMSGRNIHLTDVPVHAELAQKTSDFDTIQLMGQVWQLQEVRYNNDQTTLVNQPELYTLEFTEDGRLNIRADCNRVRGSYTVQGKQLSLQLGPMTRAACPVDSLADRYLQDLQAAKIYFIKNGKLYLDLMLDTRTMIFAPVTVSPMVSDDEDSNELVMQSWQLQELRYKNESAIAIDQPDRYSLEFTAEGTLNVRADCNRARGNYQQEGKKLSVQLGPMTLAACLGDSHANQYLQGLQAVKSYSIRDNKLYLELMLGRGTMIFVPMVPPISNDEATVDRADICAIAMDMPQTQDLETLMTLLKTDPQGILSNLETLRNSMQRLNAEGYGWHNILGHSPEIQIQPSLIGALRIACE